MAPFIPSCSHAAAGAFRGPAGDNVAGVDEDVETRLRAAAGQYEQTGQADRAGTLRREARVLQAGLDG
jgi:hypothetical protein